MELVRVRSSAVISFSFSSERGLEADLGPAPPAPAAVDGRVRQGATLVRHGDGAAHLEADERVLDGYDAVRAGGGGGGGGGRVAEQQARGDREPLARGHLEPAAAVQQVEARGLQEVGDGLPGGEVGGGALEGGVPRLREPQVDGGRGEHDVRDVRLPDGAQALDAPYLAALDREAELEGGRRRRWYSAGAALVPLPHAFFFYVGVGVGNGGRPEMDDYGSFW